MRAIILAIALCACACRPMPTAPASVFSTVEPTPSSEWKSYVPLHNNIPATFKGHPEGPIIYLCATLPRAYEGGVTEDHYLQYEPCPAVPVQ